MKRSALFCALLLVSAPAWAAAKNYGVITTRTGQTFHECKIVRVHPDGVAFTHRNGAAKIAFKDLPENMRREFRYDPQADAQYKREKEALRQEEQKRARQREIAMEEKLMEAQMAEASYLAAANAAPRVAPAPMSASLPGEPQTIVYQTPSWVGSPIGTTSLGGNVYRRSYFSGYPAYGYGGYGYGYYPGYSYPYSGCGYGYPGYGHGYNPGVYVNPTLYRSWNVGSGIRLGVGVSPFGRGVRLFP